MKPTGRGRVTRAHVVDGIRAGDEALVLVDDTPAHLGPQALTRGDAAGPGADDRALVDAARRAHRDHLDVEQIAVAAIEDLVEARVLRRT